MSLLPEAEKMTAVDQLRFTGSQESDHPTEAVAARIAQNGFLSELRGVTFAFLTLAYIVLSLLSL